MAGLTGFHYFSVTDSNCDQQKFWATKSLAGFFDVLSTNRDRNGLEFISTIEGTALPIQSENLLFLMKCTCWSIASLNHKTTGKLLKLRQKSTVHLPVFNSFVTWSSYICQLQVTEHLIYKKKHKCRHTRTEQSLVEGTSPIV